MLGLYGGQGIAVLASLGRCLWPIARGHTFTGLKSTSNTAHNPFAEQIPEVFDRSLKRAHRARSASIAFDEDPLLSTVTDRLLDRLEDCTRKFPTAVVLGGAGSHVARRLKDHRAGVEKILHLDLASECLTAAKASAASSGSASFLPDTTYIEADEEFLPLRPRSVDLIISCLGLHWVNDVPGALTQCCRALKPDGLLLAAMFGGDTLQELRISFAVAQQEREGGVSPVISPLAQVRDCGNLLTRAGLALPAVDTDSITMRYPSPTDLIRHLRAMGESNAVTTRRRMQRRDTVTAALAAYQGMFGGEDGTVPATFQVIYMAGWAPSPTQQQAAERGSGTISFEELATELEKRGAHTGGSDGLAADGPGDTKQQ